MHMCTWIWNTWECLSMRMSVEARSECRCLPQQLHLFQVGESQTAGLSLNFWVHCFCYTDKLVNLQIHASSLQPQSYTGVDIAKFNFLWGSQFGSLCICSKHFTDWPIPHTEWTFLFSQENVREGKWQGLYVVHASLGVNMEFQRCLPPPPKCWD